MLAFTHPVVYDLWEAIHDESLNDICLVATDGEVQANRFVLAARSKVLKKMFYGPFLESQSQRIPFEYEKVILEAIVEYCKKNEIPNFRLYIHRNAISARRLVQLFKAADYLQLNGLAKLVAQMAHNLTSRFPPLACAVYDEADLDTKVSRDSLLMIQSRPYVTLPPDNETEGGINCLSDGKLISIYQDTNVKAGELFLFEMLQLWNEGTDHPNAIEVVEACASHLHLEDIEPKDLLDTVMKSKFCLESSITDAITRQALRASESRVWTMSSRGIPDIERILVEGAGSKDANGLYYRIDGLTNGELFSKREVACGQQNVYTLSITVNKEETVECRIFCSKLLTSGAVTKMVRNRSPISKQFQPILQIVKIYEETRVEDKGRTSSESSRRKVTVVQLSDGDHFLVTTLSPKLICSSRCKELVQNTLVKVDKYDRIVADGKKTFQLKKISIISQDPGHRFGNPANYFDVFDDSDEDEPPSLITTTTTSTSASDEEDQIYHELINQQEELEVGHRTDNETLTKLYSVTYPSNEKPIDKIPQVGWQIDTHGIEPGPRCRWIPPPPVRSGQEKETTGEN